MNNLKSRAKPIAVVTANILLILAAIVLSYLYSRSVYSEKMNTAVNNFCLTVESMKQVVNNYLEMESQFAKDSASYIEENDMTMDEALEYLRLSNTQTDRYSHIVDMDTYEAHSTYEKAGDDSVSCYQYYSNGAGVGAYDDFLKRMQQIFTSDNDEVNVLGKYRVTETQTTVISVGKRVTLALEDGGTKDYLLLRVIPLESMKSIWVFPIQVASAEVGLITSGGDYIIPSNAMKAENFVEFIRSYNYADDYNGVNEMTEQLAEQDRGLFFYKNASGEDCYWYFSKFEQEQAVCILGYITAENLKVSGNDWRIVIITCVVFSLLLMIDGTYVWHMNRRLLKTAMLAEQASEAKTRFLSSMSHDIRTPLNGILGMTTLARQHMDNPQYVEKCLDKVSLAGSHLLTLINDILDISKVESGKMVLNQTSFSLRESVSNMINMVRPRMEEKKIHLEVSMADFPYDELIGDELRLNQIGINLLTNAVKYTNPGGTIRISVEEGDVEPEKQSACLIYRIADNGIGMSEEFQKIMYDTFSRAADSRIDKIQGSGLGLAIAKQMVELMGGTIACESQLGVGTTFTVTVRLLIADKEAEGIRKEHGEAAEQADAAEFQNMNVLVAEDNELNWEIIEELLKGDGVHCERAKDGKQCVEMINEAPPGTYDMIFMDVQMPVMNGKDAAREIRRSEQAYVREVPIYAMTADAFAEDIRDCLDAGMDGHIAKPVDMKNVRNALRAAKNKKRGEEK